MAFGEVTFRKRGTNDRIRGLITPGVAKVVAGYAQFDEIARERRSSLVEFSGQTALRVQVPVLFDGWRSGESVEALVKALEVLATPVAEQQNPPIVNVEGAIPHREGDWWIAELAWGDDVIYSPQTRERLRQDATVTLVRCTPGATIHVKPKVWHNYRIQKNGQDLRRIAISQGVRLAADVEVWVAAVRIKNKIRAGQRLKKGRVIKIP